MAACTFGASSVKISNLNLGFTRTKSATTQTLHSLTTPRPVQYHNLLISKRLGNELIGCRCKSNAEPVTSLQNASEAAKSSSATSELLPNSYEVESLLTQICDTTSIAEFTLKLGGFRLYVRRELTGNINPASAPISTPVSVNETIEESDLNGSSPSFAISKPVPPNGVQTLLDKVADQGLVIHKSQRVGYFRRSRTIKGKPAPPSCKEKQIVKEGQVLCYIEQLGGEFPVESNISGEVIQILREDGDPVGYGDALILILPSFPGIKKLQ